MRALGASLHRDRRVTGHGELRALFEDEVVGAIPAGLLTEETPRYELAMEPREAPASGRAAVNDEPKTWIFEQYDHLVGSRTVRRPGLDAAVILLEGTRGLEAGVDGPRIGERDPYQAGRQACTARP
jgi:phosphoribosylformylglycinamidine synthase